MVGPHDNAALIQGRFVAAVARDGFDALAPFGPAAFDDEREVSVLAPPMSLGAPDASHPATDGEETQKAAQKAAFVVPRDRIELPTRGFSSTTRDGGSARNDKWLRVLKGGV
ncbi:MAG: hypothetical protein RL385_2448 [Pseudomonadota bacterium]|jgi:hypothetical protein